MSLKFCHSEDKFIINDKKGEYFYKPNKKATFGQPKQIYL